MRMNFAQLMGGTGGNLVFLRASSGPRLDPPGSGVDAVVRGHVEKAAGEGDAGIKGMRREGTGEMGSVKDDAGRGKDRGRKRKT